jgi:actin-related protein
MMEKFNTPAMFIGIQTLLSLYAAGRQTGTALSIGAGATQVTPVNKGFAISGASTCLKLGGHDLRLNLAKILTEGGFTMSNHHDFLDHAQNMLEKLCYVAWDFEQEMQSPSKKAKVEDESYELPDGEIITPRDEKFRCPEVLFQPSLLGNLNEYDIEEGIHKMCFDTISKCDFEIHPLLYKNIVLSGGCTMFPGLPERLTKEIQGLVPAATKVKVIAPEHRKNSVWIGGSILASLSMFKDMWITKEQYGELGPAVIHKCPSA